MEYRRVMIGLLSAALLVSCGIGGEDHCPGGAVRDPGAATSSDPGSVLLAYVGDDPETAHLNSNAYRIDGDQVIVEASGEALTLRLSPDFAVHGCDETGVIGLREARFGATFSVQMSSMEIVQAGCNGCM